MQSIPGWAWVLISLAVAILLWYVLSINPKTARSFPFIPAILEAAKRMIDNGALGQDFCSSMISILAGFALGFITAVPIAFLMAWYLPVRGVLEPWIQFIRNIPPLAYVPLVVITAGVGRKPQIIVIWIATFLIMTVTIYQGVRNIDNTLVKAARVLGARQRYFCESYFSGNNSVYFDSCSTWYFCCTDNIDRSRNNRSNCWSGNENPLSGKQF